MKRQRGRAIVCVGIAMGLFQCFAWSQVATLSPTLELRKIGVESIPFQNGIPMPTFEKQNHPMVLLGGEWKKHRFAANHDASLLKRDSVGMAAITDSIPLYTVGFDDINWPSIYFPAVENTMPGYEKAPETYQDGVWYRKSFSVPGMPSGQAVLLKFLAVNYVADVWLNGKYLGYHEGGYTPFAFDVTDVVRLDTVNVIAVRVDNPSWGTRKDIVPFFRVDWFNYTGIIQDVYLEFLPRTYIVRTDVLPLDTLGNIHARVTIANRGDSTRHVEVHCEAYKASVDNFTIYSEKASDLIGLSVPLGGLTTVALTTPTDSVETARLNFSIDHPALWSPWHPNLYVLKVTIVQAGNIIDEWYTQCGVRTASVGNGKFLLNGKPAYFTGIARHEDHYYYGRAFTPSLIVPDLKVIKNINVSFLRTAHYPNHPFTYIVADRLGLAAWEEIPVWWFDAVEEWQIQNTLRHIHQQMWREMIFRDFNRPSIMFWSACNECMDVTNRADFIRTIHQDMDANYPNGRLVTQSAAADRPGPNDPSMAECDIAGWTMYFGIFYGQSKYRDTQKFLQDAHTAYPLKPIIDTEFGSWSQTTGSSQLSQTETFDSTFAAFQPYVQRDSLGKVNDAGFLAATTWWTAFDWYTSQQPMIYQTMGAFHMDRKTTKLVTSHLVNGYHPYYVNGEVTSVEKVNAPIAEGYELEQNYPNPFNPSTVFGLRVAKSGVVKVEVFDLLGNTVATLMNEQRAPGTYELRFNAAGLASGVYFYRLTAGGVVQSRKMLLLK